MAKSKRHAKQFKVSRRKFGGQLHRSLLGGLLLLLLPAQVDLFAGIARGREPGTGNREVSEGIRSIGRYRGPGFWSLPSSWTARALSSASCGCRGVVPLKDRIGGCLWLRYLGKIVWNIDGQIKIHRMILSKCCAYNSII